MSNAVFNPEHLVWFEKYVDLGHDRSLSKLSVVLDVEKSKLEKISELENWSRMLEKYHLDSVIKYREKRDNLDKLAKTLNLTTGTCAAILNKSFQTDELGNVRLDNDGAPLLKDHLSPASATEAAGLMSTMATLAKTSAQLSEMDEDKKGKELDIKLLQQIEDEDLDLWAAMNLFEKNNRPIVESLKIKAKVLQVKTLENHGDVNIHIDMDD